MCGLAGFYSTGHVFNSRQINNMLNVINHRGPDSSGVFSHNNCTLGHNRLSIIDLSAQANQPMYSASRNTVVVFNGEIYNHKQIASQLNIKARTNSDTEIIVEAFELLGPAFVNLLNGMFSIAIYSLKSQELYLFRDRVGIKPLFYFYQNNNLAFASELKSLLQLSQIKNNLFIDNNSVARFLNLGYIPAPGTIYQSIKKFPQGHFAKFDGTNLYFEQYWSVANSIKPNSFIAETQAAENLKTLLTKSVEYRLMSDVPFGTFLSGGIDSSLVTAVAQSIVNTPVNTFSIGFSNVKHNESGYAAAVAKYLGTNHRQFILEHKQAIELIPDIFTYWDEPFADSSALPTMLVSKMARQHVTMALSGDGGDELFQGYGMYRWAQRLDSFWFKVIRPVLPVLLCKMPDKYRRVAHLLKYPPYGHQKTHLFSQEQYFFALSELKQMLTANIKLQPLANENFVFNKKLNAGEKQALFDLYYYLPDDLLTKVDRGSMRFSLEARVPLLDHNIVEFAANLPYNLKVKNGTEKYLLKKLLYNYAPQSLFDRPKWGFSIPLKNWLNNELNFLIIDYLNQNKVEQAGLVNYNYVSGLLKNYRLPQNGYLYNRVWTLIVLHRWYYSVYKQI